MKKRFSVKATRRTSVAAKSATKSTIAKGKTKTKPAAVTGDDHQDMLVELKIDNRECKNKDDPNFFINTFTEALYPDTATVSRGNLDIGDFQILAKHKPSARANANANVNANASTSSSTTEIANNTSSSSTDDTGRTPIVLIERKTINDYESSKRNGHMDEQYHRMAASPFMFKVLIVEGPGTLPNRDSIFVSNGYHHNICTLFTRNVDDTISVITQWVKKIARDAKDRKIFKDKATEHTLLQCADYALNLKKCLNVSKSTILASAIRPIPGFGDQKLSMVMGEFESLGAFVDALRNDACADKYRKAWGRKEVGTKNETTFYDLCRDKLL